MAIHNSLASLQAEMQSRINKALDNEVAQIVKEQISESVKDIVYGAGTPMLYNRRDLTNGSLGDVNEMTHKVSNGVLIVEDHAEPSGNDFKGNDFVGEKDFASRIEYGYGNEDTWYNSPREFMKDAADKLNSNGKVTEALQKALGSEFGVSTVITKIH